MTRVLHYHNDAGVNACTDPIAHRGLCAREYPRVSVVLHVGDSRELRVKHYHNFCTLLSGSSRLLRGFVSQADTKGLVCA